MRKAKDSSSNGPKLVPGDEGYVGRGHPPKHSQIKEGEVRNKWGRSGKPRPEKKIAHYDERMAQLLTQPKVAKDGQSYEQLEVVLNSLFKVATAGNLKAIDRYLELLRTYTGRSSTSLDEENLDVSDEAILARYAQHILAGTDGPRQLAAEVSVEQNEDAGDV